MSISEERPELPETALLFRDETAKKRKRHLFISLGVFGFTLFLSLVTLISSEGIAEEPVTVYVSRQNLEAPHTMRAEEMETRLYPSNLLPPSVITVPEDIIGRLLVTSVAEGELLLQHHFHPLQFEATSLPSRIDPGKFAFTFPESWDEGPFPALQEGDLVQIVANLNRGDLKSTDIITDPLRVISIEENKNAGGKLLTLNVSKADARMILLGRGARIPLHIVVLSRQ